MTQFFKKPGTIKQALLVLAFLMTLHLTPALANGAQFLLEPGSKEVPSGEEFKVEIRIDTGGSSVNAVQANLNYPEDKLELVRIDMGGSDFEVGASHEGGSGEIKIGRGNIEERTGRLLVASLIFKSLGGGDAKVDFAEGTALVDSGQEVETSKQSATYTLTGDPISQPDNDASEGGPLSISDIQVESASPRQAIITWRTSRPATSLLEYGVDNGYGLRVESSELVTEHRLVIDGEFLEPETLYHFRVTSTGQDGVSQTSDSFTFITDPELPIWLLAVIVLVTLVMMALAGLLIYPRSRRAIWRRLRQLDPDNKIETPLPSIVLPPAPEEQPPSVPEEQPPTAAPQVATDDPAPVVDPVPRPTTPAPLPPDTTPASPPTPGIVYPDSQSTDENSDDQPAPPGV